MYINKKNFILVLLMAVALFSFWDVSALAEENIKVYVNNEIINFDTEPVIENNRTLVPIRAITEAMGCNVEWNDKRSEAVISNLDETITIKIGGKQIFVRDNFTNETVSIEIDVSAKLHNDRTYVPLRAISEGFGANVLWNDKNSSAMIEYTPPAIVEFKDKAMEYYTRKILSAYSYDKYLPLYEGYLTQKVLNNVQEISIYSQTNKNMHIIESIEDIIHLPNLVNLEIPKQNVRDITPLLYKKHWNSLDLNGNPIENDISTWEQLDVNHVCFPKYQMASHGELYQDILARYSKINDKMENFLHNFDNKMGDYEKFKFIHDFIILNMEYDFDKYKAMTSENYNDYESQYYPDNCSQLFIAGKGVCQNYACTYSELCTYVGLECWVVTGIAGGADGWYDHAWNIVNIDGNYYHVDLTWDDPDDDNNIKYDYFLVSDSTLSDDHKWGGNDCDDFMFSIISDVDQYEQKIPLCLKDYDRNTNFEDTDADSEDYSDIGDNGDRVIDGINYNMTEIIYAAQEELNIPERENIDCIISVPEFNEELQEYIVWVRFYENDKEMASASWCIESKQFYTRYSEFENY